MCSTDQLLKELDDLLTIYGKRIEVLRDVFQLSGGAAADQISLELNEILLENTAVHRRFKSNIESKKSDVLVDVWNICQMKQIYHPVLKKYATAAAICATWRNDSKILEALDKKNRDIMKDDFHRYVNTSSFPTLVKDHLFNLLNLLVKYSTKVQTPVRNRFEELIQWLDREQPTVGSVKGFSASSQELKNELILKMDTFRLPTCDSKDAEKADVILSANYVFVRTVRGGMFRKDETVEHQSVTQVRLQGAYDDATFELLGVGFTKVLSADCSRTRDEWVQSIQEVQKSLIKTR